MGSFGVFDVVGEVGELVFEDFLDVGVVEQRSSGAASIGKDAVPPFVDSFIALEFWRDDDLIDAGSAAQVFDTEGGGFSFEVMLGAEGDSIRQVISPIYPKFSFNQVVSIDGRLSTDHTALVVSSEDLLFELFAGQEVHLVLFLWYFVWGLVINVTTVPCGLVTKWNLYPLWVRV
jgi:hypothetical protein